MVETDMVVQLVLDNQGGGAADEHFDRLFVDGAGRAV